MPMLCERAMYNCSLYLDRWFFRKLPVVGFELVELVKLQAYVLHGQLQQIPEPGQVLCCGPRVGVHVLNQA